MPECTGFWRRLAWPSGTWAQRARQWPCSGPFSRDGAGSSARGAALAAAPSVLLAAWWFVRTSTADGTVRRIGWYVASLGRNLAQLDDVAAYWLVPPTVGGGSLTAAAVLVAAVVWSSARDAVWRPVEAARAARGALLYVGSYGIVLLGSRMFLDPGIPFDFRILSPILVLATICIAASVVEVARRRGGLVAGAIGIVVGAWAGMNWVQVRATVRTVKRERTLLHESGLDQRFADRLGPRCARRPGADLLERAGARALLDRPTGHGSAA